VGDIVTQTKQYLDLVQYILDNGQTVKDRTGVGTISCFGLPTMTFDLQKSFPLVTAKRTPFKGTFEELRWFLEGSDNINKLDPAVRPWWNPWADHQGYLPYMYGFQWSRKNQKQKLVDGIKNNPTSRRHVVTMWNPETVDSQPLACCHGTVIQCYVRGGYLDMATYQRSADATLGLPINIASYALLLSFITKLTNYQPGKLFYTLGDAHVYSNHIEQCKEMLSRPLIEEPTLIVSDNCKTWNDFKYENFTLVGYNPHPSIKAEMAV
jgi:thymidylate synthase